MNDRSVPVAALLREGTDRFAHRRAGGPRGEGSDTWPDWAGSAPISSPRPTKQAAGAVTAPP